MSVNRSILKKSRHIGIGLLQFNPSTPLPVSPSYLHSDPNHFRISGSELTCVEPSLPPTFRSYPFSNPQIWIGTDLCRKILKKLMQPSPICGSGVLSGPLLPQGLSCSVEQKGRFTDFWQKSKKIRGFRIKMKDLGTRGPCKKTCYKRFLLKYQLLASRISVNQKGNG